MLTYNRGFIEREVLSICTFDDNQYDRNRELKLIYQARTGDTQSMIYLGETYSAGSFTPKNPSKAIDWLYLARAMGNINASCDVCKHYYHLIMITSFFRSTIPYIKDYLIALMIFHCADKAR